MRDDPFDLERFLLAQEPVYAAVRSELVRGRKTTHWIWFIFPQLYGLGQSPRSQRYGIRSREETLAYLAHPVLGPRLFECTSIVCDHKELRIADILSAPDDTKFHSSMTLFGAVSRRREFEDAIYQFFGGIGDEATLSMLGI